jgi:hypothetical protein
VLTLTILPRVSFRQVSTPDRILLIIVPGATRLARDIARLPDSRIERGTKDRPHRSRHIQEAGVGHDPKILACIWTKRP